MNRDLHPVAIGTRLRDKLFSRSRSECDRTTERQTTSVARSRETRLNPNDGGVNTRTEDEAPSPVRYGKESVALATTVGGMSTPQPTAFPLTMADEGAKVRIHGVRAGRALAHRLTDLGLNPGSEIQVVQRQGGGLLVARGEGRFAIGGGMAGKILVVPL